MFRRPPVTELLRTLRMQYAGIRAHIVEGLSAETYERLLGRSIDIGLLYDPAPHRDLSCESLAVENMFLLGRREQIAALGRIRDLAQLDNLPLILPKSPNSRRLLVEKALRERSLVLNLAAEVDGFATTHALLRAGMGFSIMTYAALQGLGGDKALAAVEIEAQGLQWHLHLAQHRSQLKNQVLNEVAAVIRRVIARLIANRRWKGITLLATPSATKLQA